MHELGITQSILDIAESVSKENGGVRVKKIRIRMGEYSGIVPSLVEEYFPIVSAGTASEGASLEIIPVPASIRCLDCSYEGSIPKETCRCPKCGGYSYKLLTGREFYVESLEAEEPDEEDCQERPEKAPGTENSQDREEFMNRFFENVSQI